MANRHAAAAFATRRLGAVGRALRTVPRARDWAEAAGLFGMFAAIALPLGFVSGVYAWAPHWDAGVTRTALIALVAPALGEELVFRGLLSPGRGDKATPATILVPLALYVGWHPFTALTFLPHAAPIFLDPAFLTICALLGGACAVSLRRSGSIWPAVAMHWALVVFWKACLDAPAVL
jgi:uncharacterized protein